MQRKESLFRGDFGVSVPAFDLKFAEGESQGTIEGYASVFGVEDQGRDTVQAGAFRDSLNRIKAGQVKMLWQHDPSQPIGVWESIMEDQKGLKVRGRLLKEVARGREAAALVEAGAIDGLSIGYRTKEFDRGPDGYSRTLKAVDLHEISLVTFPMLREATLTGHKSLSEMTIREFEGVLRDAGFSRAEAKAVAARGFDGLTVRDAGAAEHDGLAEAIAEARRAFA